MSPEDATRTLLAPDPSVLRRPRILAIWDGGSTACSLPESGAAEIVVGRAVDCDLRVNAESVSRRHAAFRVSDGQVRVRDLGSANGTRVDGRRLAADEQCVVLPGQSVAIGSAVLVVQAGLADEPGAPPPTRAARPASPLPTSPMAQVHFLIDQIAQGDISVVLMGETGVGKEVTASRIHTQSRRASKPYVKLNCAALAESMLESEIFGHERGAFTGAVATKPGLFEAADGGTVLLDEVTELGLPIQAKLLRVIESHEVTRLGSVKPRAIDVRFVAATNQDLPALVQKGRFRADLYFRLCGISVRIPPLRERRADIAGLAQQFLQAAAAKLGRPVPALTPAALAWLEGYAWPGNIRELRNLMDRAALLAHDGIVDRKDVFDPDMAVAETVGPVPQPQADPAAPTITAQRVGPRVEAAGSLSHELADVERRRITLALEQAAGNQTAAARLLGISRKVLLGRLDQYQLPRPRKKVP